MRELGRVQLGCIDALQRHTYWRPGGGWYWGTVGRTQKIIDSLVKRGLVHQDAHGTYRLTEAGKATNPNVRR